jgi:hypothetical protein
MLLCLAPSVCPISQIMDHLKRDIVFVFDGKEKEEKALRIIVSRRAFNLK